jgi:hypothetical protein
MAVDFDIRDPRDTQYLYFKPSGEWKYAGYGAFPKNGEVTRESIKANNKGKFPGITGTADEFTIVVIPLEGCKNTLAYPRLLFSETK